MTNLTKNQNGLGVIELLFGILVITALAIGGWFVYKNQQPATDIPESTANETTTSSSNQTPVSSDNKNIITFKEIGVQITVPDSIKDITYKVFTYSGANAVIHSDSGKAINSVAANISTDSLVAKDSSCSAASSPLGILIKVSGTYPKNPNANNAGGTLVKQFSNYYIGYIGNSAGGCSALPQKRTFNQALLSLTVIK